MATRATTSMLLLLVLLATASWAPHPVAAAISSPVVKGSPEPQAFKAVRDEDLEVEMVSPPCSQDLTRELVEAVRSLLPLKKQIAVAQLQVQEIYNASLDTKRLVDRIKSDESATAALREEVARLRREMTQTRVEHEAAVAAARSHGKTSRAQVLGRCEAETMALQSECVAKIMQLGGEAEQALALVRAEHQQAAALLDTLNATKEAELAEVRSENALLRSQLDTLNLTLTLECGATNSSEAPEWLLKSKRRQPKLSPGKFAKEESSSSVSKMPSSTYKHSCKGFNEPAAPVAPFSHETSIRIGNRQYIVGKDKVTWGEAWRLCKARGMWVLSLETEQEQQQLEPHMMHMHNTPTSYWMFARKPQNNGWFSWECAESEFEPWRHQQPAPGASSYSQQQQVRCAHVELHRGEATWGDDACDAKMGYICRQIVTEC